MEFSVALTLQLVLVTLLLIGDLFAKKEATVKIVVESKPDDCSEFAGDGDQVAVHYTGYLDSGAVFDSSVQQKRDPIEFVLGSHQVIPGWEQGLQGMCVGEKRKLTIPPHLAYGKKGHPPVIPPESTLTFETELISVKKPTSEFNIIKILQFMAVPAFVIYVVYYLYDRYKKETKAQSTSKAQSTTKAQSTSKGEKQKGGKKRK